MLDILFFDPKASLEALPIMRGRNIEKELVKKHFPAVFGRTYDPWDP